MTKKKVLIISSSLRPDSNSHALCEQVAKGVEAAGGEAQLKAVLDRSVQFWPEPRGKPYYVVATMAENASFDNVLAAIQGYMDCFDGARIAGSVLATEVYEQGAVKSTKFMQEAFDLGKKIVA